jgi:D-alanyl-D-alanine carboxypeptidase
MSGSSVLSGGRRRPPRRRGRSIALAALAAAIALAGLLVALDTGAFGPASKAGTGHRGTIRTGGAAAGSRPAHPTAAARAAAAAPAVPAIPAGYGIARAPAGHQVSIRLRAPLRSGMLFDVHSGRVLWQRDPDRSLPIASLTKMMTALIVVAMPRDRPRARVLITRQAVHFQGSGVGLLPVRKRVPLEPLLYGLLLPSGNDAAIALAQHVAGTQRRFIAIMNAEAGAMGLGCTHYTTVSGIVDAGNYSCAVDLAKLARALLDEPRLKRIVGSASAVLRFPIKGGKLFLYNNNPLYRLAYPGTDGVKTGYTTAAGVCLVATARRGRTWLGVVLLHSGDDIDQAPALLNAGFAALRRG